MATSVNVSAEKTDRIITIVTNHDSISFKNLVNEIAYKGISRQAKQLIRNDVNSLCEKGYLESVDNEIGSIIYVTVKGLQYINY